MTRDPDPSPPNLRYIYCGCDTRLGLYKAFPGANADGTPWLMREEVYLVAGLVNRRTRHPRHGCAWYGPSRRRSTRFATRLPQRVDASGFTGGRGDTADAQSGPGVIRNGLPIAIECPVCSKTTLVKSERRAKMP